MTGRLDGKIAFITGAASGIGLGTVEKFVAEGAKVLAADVQDEKGAMLEARFPGVVAYRHCDVTDTDQIKAAIDAAVEVFGGLDAVFNNAGAAGTPAGLADIVMADWRGVMDLLLTSVMAGTKYAIPHLLNRGGGAIINTASIAGLQAGYGPIAYSTAKGAVVHFSRCAAAELSPQKIRVNSICPGLIATSIFGTAMGMDRQGADQMAAFIHEKGGGAQPIGRPGYPSDIAEAACWLASDGGSFVTGASFTIDGGITIGPVSAWDAATPSPFLKAIGVSPEDAEAMRLAMLAQKA